MFSAMPPKKATAAQKGKAVPETRETSRAQRVTRARTQTMPDVVPQSEGSTVPLPEGSGATTAITLQQVSMPDYVKRGMIYMNSILYWLLAHFSYQEVILIM